MQYNLQNVTGKFSKSNLKNSPISKTAKRKMNTSQDKNSELSVLSRSPSVDIQKELNKIKSAVSRKTGKLHRINRISENDVCIFKFYSDYFLRNLTIKI
jgi:hypothetical protein